MKNYIQEGEHITIVATAAVTSGQGVLAGSLFGVATADAVIGQPVAIKRRGVFTLPKTNAEAWTVGAKVYWSSATGALTTTSAGNTLVGVAVEAAANPSAIGTVLLDGTVR